MWSSTAQYCIYCPSNWTIAGDHCYITMRIPSNFYTALSSCQNMSATLAPIKTMDDFYYIQSYSFYYGADVWVFAS